MNLYAYVGGDPVNWFDPEGLSGGNWMFHSNDHGGPHFQKGNQRYDAKTLDPIKHKGEIPPDLSKSERKRLEQSKAWSQMFRYFQNIKSAPFLLLLPGQEQMFDNMLHVRQLDISEYSCES